jgi:AraC-like DNA-binding protein
MPQTGDITLPESCRTTSPARRPVATPVILDAGSRALYLGPSFALAGHRNTVAVIAFGLEGEFALQGDARATPTLQRCALIPPGCWQQLDARGGAMAFLYLDADDRGWRALAQRVGSAHRHGAQRDGGMRLDEDAALQGLLGVYRTTTAPAVGYAVLLDALDLPPSGIIDNAIAGAMARVRQAPGDTHPVAMHARLAGCAASTFQRRFTTQAGLPWRRWRLWQRLRHAARAICNGASLTDAAHAAGFASGAHFSDAFRSTFGLPPSRLLDWGVRWLRITGE